MQFKPRPKTQYIRSPALMKAYRLLPCQHCGADDGTVCGAHSNWSEHGKGRGIKASDDKCASLCFACHSWLDQGSGDGYEKRAMWDAAHTKTHEALIALSWDNWRLRALLVKLGLVTP